MLIFGIFLWHSKNIFSMDGMTPADNDTMNYTALSSIGYNDTKIL